MKTIEELAEKIKKQMKTQIVTKPNEYIEKDVENLIIICDYAYWTDILFLDNLKSLTVDGVEMYGSEIYNYLKKNCKMIGY